MTWTEIPCKIVFSYSDNQKTMEYKYDIIAILKSFDVVKKQIFLLGTKLGKAQFKWKGSIYTVQLLCLMCIELVQGITWV